MCAGETGSINIENIEGYQNTVSNILWQTGVSEYELTGIESGWYVFTIEYDNDCSYQDSIYLGDVDPLTYGLEIMPSACEEAEDGSLEFIDVSGGTAPYNYSMDGINYQTESGFYDLSAGDYTAYLLDDNGCIQTEAIEIFFQELNLISLGSNIEVEAGTNIFLNPMINESSIDSFSWSQNPAILNPGELIAEVEITESSSFTLEIFYGDCVESRSIIISVKETDEIYIPNIFSLNRTTGFGSFYVQAKEDSNIIIESVRIYDRWGNMIFIREDILPNDPQNAWDGYYNDEKVDPGVFVYVVQYSLNATQHIQSGSITVVR